MKPEKAILANRRRGENVEEELYEFINDYEGLSVYEIAQRKRWSYGKVGTALKRLEKKGLVYFKYEQGKGKTRKLVYATDVIDLLPKEILERLKSEDKTVSAVRLIKSIPITG